MVDRLAVRGVRRRDGVRDAGVRRRRLVLPLASCCSARDGRSAGTASSCPRSRGSPIPERPAAGDARATRGFVTFAGVVAGPPFALGVVVVAHRQLPRPAFASSRQRSAPCLRSPAARAVAPARSRVAERAYWGNCRRIRRTESTIDRIPDIDPQETREWRFDALDGVRRSRAGPDRAHFPDRARSRIDRAPPLGRLPAVFGEQSAYINIDTRRAKQVRIPGDQNLEHRIRSIARWNAMRDGGRAREATGTANVGGRQTRAFARPRRKTLVHRQSASQPLLLTDVIDANGGDPRVSSRADSVRPRGCTRARSCSAGSPRSSSDNFRQEVDGRAAPLVVSRIPG